MSRERDASAGASSVEGAERRARCFVLVMCGLPGAGKSTLARALDARGRARRGVDASVVWVCFDAIERETRGREGGGEWDRDAWRRGRAAAKARLRAAIERGVAGEGETVVIVDDNMYYSGMRYEVFREARDRGAACAACHARASVETARERNGRRTGSERVGEASFDRMVDAFEAPEVTAPGDFSTAFPAFVIDTSETVDAEAFWTRASAYWGPAPPRPSSDAEREVERARARAETSASATHALDVRTRGVVARTIARAKTSGLAPDAVARVAGALNDARRELLGAFRTRLRRWNDSSDPDAESPFDAIEEIAREFDASAATLALASR